MDKFRLKGEIMLRTKVTLKFGSTIEKTFEDYKQFKDWMTELELHENRITSYEITNLNNITRPDDIETVGNSTRELLLNKYSDSDWDILNEINESGSKLKYNC
jgi:hypothetical protein